MPKMVYSLDEDISNISNKVGGKAANLSALLSAGQPVPTGLAVSIEAFDSKGRLQGKAKDAITSWISDRQYAVRSSATVEDAADMSWAGQFESYLYVAASDVIAKVEECHGAVKARALAYASEAVKEHTFDVGVVVQEMIDPEYAGVIFTENPVTGNHELVAEYVSGVGEQLVSGKVTPKDFVWDRKTGSLVAEDPVPFNTDELTTRALEIEAAFDDAPQDIEWAIDKKGKLWITQSRPITTLNIEHAGKGYHYLGDPQKLFYWGPASGRALYMSDFLHAIQKRFAQWFQSNDYPNPPKTLILLHDDKFLWLNKKISFERFAERVFESYARSGDIDSDRTAWQKAVDAIDPSVTYEPLQLLELLDNVWQQTFAAEFALYGAEAAITKQLADFNEQQQHRIWGTFSLPDKPTFINQIDEAVSLSKDPHALAQQYPWALNSYAGVASSDSLVEYFTQRISDLEGNSEVILASNADRQALAKQLKLPANLVKQLDLTRKIAEFMDDRKAWMLQSRKVIQSMVTARAKQLQLNTKLLERCRIEDLASPKPAEYFGWTYIDGQNIDLGKKDVQRSWDWYVEYRTFTNVLHGIVSSRGGKHFMAGEVVVVHDPAEHVPDGKIVVVPSTGPSFVPIMRNAAALITDHGGMMSHAAIVAREFNLPCIVGTVHATKVLKTGDKVTLDLVKGEVNK